MRLFVAISLPEDSIADLARIVARLRRRDDGLRWSDPETWHLTLQFLGETSQATFDCMLPRLGAIRMPPVPITFAELGVFERAGVFFAGVAATRELVLLQQHITAATGACGVVAETRPYRPHITLARSKGRGAGMRELESKAGVKPPLRDFVAAEFLLLESFLEPAGARHILRERFPFAQARSGSG